MYNQYVERIRLWSEDAETQFIMGQRRTCYNGIYPFKLFPNKELDEIELHPITIFYGGNGSGKTTLLNIIAEKAQIMRHSAYSGGAFFSKYVNGCVLYGKDIPKNSQILTSDDVFDYLLNIRYLNDGIDVRREELFEDYLDRKYTSHRGIRLLIGFYYWYYVCFHHFRTFVPETYTLGIIEQNDRQGLIPFRIGRRTPFLQSGPLTFHFASA